MRLKFTSTLSDAWSNLEVVFVPSPIMMASFEGSFGKTPLTLLS